MAIDWGTELGGNSPQQSQGSVGNAAVASGSAQSGAKMAEPQHDPVKMLQYAKDAGTRSVESMGQIGSSWFDGTPQVYDDDQIAAAKSAISRAQTPEEVMQIVQGLTGQNHGGNVGPINNALGQMGVGYSSNVGLSDIGRSVRSMTGTLDPVDVSAEDDYERALQWLGNAIPNVAAISDLAIPLPSGTASAVHLYKEAKALPGKVAGWVKAAPGKAADWYKGRYNAYSNRLAGKKPAASAERTAASETAASAGETAQTGGRAAETAAPAAERTAASETAAPAAERTAASETAAPAPRQEPAPQQPAPAPRQEPAPQQPAPAAERTAASETAADGGVSELANAGNAGREAAGREAATAGEQAAGREAATAGEQAAGREAAAGEAAADGGVSELANAGSAGRVERVPSLDIYMVPNESIYSAIGKFMMDQPGGANAVQDAIGYVTGKVPAIEDVTEALSALPRSQLEQVFMNLRGWGY